MFRTSELRTDDIKKIAQLEWEIFSDPWSENALADTMHERQAVIFCSWKEEELAGYVIVYYVLDEGEIARIAVKQTCRRQGVAGLLLERVEEFCVEKNISRLLLDVRESNAGAIKFYKKHGFREDGIRKKFYTNPAEDAILMSRMVRR